MKAAYIEKTGASDQIIIGDLPVPVINDNEVLVKVTYTTVNHVDCYIRSGKYARQLPNPYIIGRDFCGEVVQIGKAVKQFKVGDKVWSNCQGIDGRQGTFAQYLAVKENTIFHLSRNVDPLQAVAVLHSTFTAILGLEREAQAKAGQVIYIHGAAGNIGAALIHTAKFLGLSVIAGTHGQEKIDYCYQLGADVVIDYKDDVNRNIRKFAPDGVNIFWNTSRFHDFKLSLPLLALKGRYILMAGSGNEATFSVGELYTNDASIRGFTISNATMEEVEQTAEKINSLLEHQSVGAKIDKVLALEDARQAHDLMESGSAWGKIMIKISHD